ncbi:glycosyltransferase [Candidatus Pacearchaeota archaeon]|nr:glycosyltransferase [Candidatus Pacearchaeota archaeon]
MISIVITSFNEPKTIGKAIGSFLSQNLNNYELIISAPDEETLNIARSYARKNRRIKVIRDKGKGKPAALNLIFKVVRGSIIILTDGDVFVSPDSAKNLVKRFRDKTVGGVTGRILSTNPRNSLFGFWAYFLTEAFHDMRMQEEKNRKNVICSGYLYAIRKGIIQKIPEEIMADDAFVSLAINKAGLRTVYEPLAKVSVKYPTNLPDWIRQKKRTSARFYQLKKYYPISKAHSLRGEIISGARAASQLRSPKEFFLLSLLGVMRAYIWGRVFFDVRLWKRGFKKTWERVESTK